MKKVAIILGALVALAGAFYLGTSWDQVMPSAPDGITIEGDSAYFLTIMCGYKDRAGDLQLIEPGTDEEKRMWMREQGFHFDREVPDKHDLDVPCSYGQIKGELRGVKVVFTK